MRNEDGVNEFDYTSLEQFLNWEFDQSKQNQEKLNRFKMALDKKRVQDQYNAERRAIEELNDLESLMDRHNVEMSASMKKKFLEDYKKEQEQKDKEALIKYWQQYSDRAQQESARKQQELDKEYEYAKKVAELKSKALDKETKAKAAQEKVTKAEASVKNAKTEKEKKEAEKKLAQAKKELQSANKEKKEASKEAYSYEHKGDFAKSSQLIQKEKQIISDEKGKSFGDRLAEQFDKSMKQLAENISKGLNQINEAISTYASYQTEINARLQGVSDFGKAVETLQAVSYSPLIRTEELYSNLSELVSQGISANVEQRAFLQTVKDGIATTFNANDASLRRIIRLQQADSTAARLGMEAYLTAFLNQLTNNTEYLQSTFDSVAESMLEASSLLSIRESTEFEYVVQKWLGTFTGYGLSEATATAIGQAIGQLASGNVSSLSNSSMQNLVVMAAARSGLDYGSLLQGGLSSDQTNQLLYSMFNYIASMSGDNNVVMSELARTFGISISDIVAARNVANSGNLSDVFGSMMTYSDMYNELGYQMNQLATREGISNILENLFSNITFGTGMNIASNPVTYAIWKIADVVQSATGGINIPFITAMGSGIDLNATVEGLMKLGVAGVSFLSNIGNIVSGIGSAFGDNAAGLLGTLGITPSNVSVRGQGLSSALLGRTSGVATSLTTVVGNASGEDYSSSTLNAARDEQQANLDAATSEETSTDKLLKIQNATQDDMYKTLQQVQEDLSTVTQQLSQPLSVTMDLSNIGFESLVKVM